jgi:hypothetical protein
MVETGILAQGVDGGKAADPCLSVRDGPRRRRNDQDSKDLPDHPFIVLCASPSGRRLRRAR